jgi:hypothetical protein
MGESIGIDSLFGRLGSIDPPRSGTGSGNIPAGRRKRTGGHAPRRTAWKKKPSGRTAVPAPQPPKTGFGPIQGDCHCLGGPYSRFPGVRQQRQGRQRRLEGTSPCAGLPRSVEMLWHAFGQGGPYSRFRGPPPLPRPRKCVSSVRSVGSVSQVPALVLAFQGRSRCCGSRC